MSLSPTPLPRALLAVALYAVAAAGHAQHQHHEPQVHDAHADHAGHAHHEHHGDHSESAQQPREPIPPVTDADRAAAFPDLHHHMEHPSDINFRVLFDRLEWQDADAGSAFAWETKAWVG